jgi:hypothetical protein
MKDCSPWLARVKANKELDHVVLPDEERTGYLPRLIKDHSHNECWKCRKLVFPDDWWPDALGFGVHKACSDQLAQEEHQLPATALRNTPLLSREATNRK